MIIRQATISDLEEISLLCQQLFAEMATLQPDSFIAAQPEKDVLQEFIQNDVYYVIVAQSNVDLTGLAIAVKQRTMPYNMLVQHNYAFLMDIIVDKNFRSQGIGKKLLDKVKLWAKAHALDYLALNVLAENNDAQKLYQREGFYTKRQVMHFEL